MTMQLFINIVFTWHFVDKFKEKVDRIIFELEKDCPSIISILHNISCALKKGSSDLFSVMQ